MTKKTFPTKLDRGGASKNTYFKSITYGPSRVEPRGTPSNLLISLRK
jgi:hypothetical protein